MGGDRCLTRSPKKPDILGRMRIREILRSVNDPSSATHALVSTGIVTGLALIEPRALSTGRRLAYRCAVAGLTAWVMWTSLRPGDEDDADLLGPAGRVAITTGIAGTALGFAEASEAIDARVHDVISRAGARHPRLWLAAGEAVFSVLAWRMTRQGDRIGSKDDQDIEMLDRVGAA